MADQLIAVETEPDRVRVIDVRTKGVLLTHHAPADARPFIHPLEAPGGIGSVTEDAPHHHPWQHGLYVGLNDVGGYGFWSEGLSPSNADIDGSFRSRVVGTPLAVESTAHWTIATSYVDPHGDVCFEDAQGWTLEARDDATLLKLDWKLTAQRDLTFGQFDYGGLFLRMPYRLGIGGAAVTSEGSGGDGERARWAAVRMALPETEEVATVAILDHPSNLDHPVHWRIDSQLGVAPSPCIAGAWHLARGESKTFFYGVLVGRDTLRDADIDLAWKEFAL